MFTIDSNQPAHPQPAFQEFKSSWYETASKMRGCGVTLAALGLFLAAATLGGLIVFSGYPLYNSTYALLIGVAGSAGAIAPVVLGIYLMAKNYWKDPAFCQKKQDNIKICLAEKGYAAARKKYHSKSSSPADSFGWDAHSLISKEEIRQRVEQREIQGKEYADYEPIVTDLILDGIFESTYFDEKLNKEINTSLQQEGYVATKGKYSDNWGGIITTEEIQKAMLAHFEEKTYAAIQKDKKNDISVLYDDGILPRDHYKELFLQENIGLSFSEFLTTYGWQPFADRVVSAEDQTESGSESQYAAAFYPSQTFSQRFLEELDTLATFGEAYSRFPDFWKLFTYGVARGVDFHDRAVATFAQNSFVAMINAYGWNLFEKEIVSAIDVAVEGAFGTYLRDGDFTAFIDAPSYYTSAVTYKLIHEGYRTQVERYKGWYEMGKSTHDTTVQRADDNYAAAVTAATAQREKTIEHYTLRVTEEKAEVDRMASHLAGLESQIRAKGRELSSLEQEQRTTAPVPALPNVAQDSAVPSLPQPAHHPHVHDNGSLCRMSRLRGEISDLSSQSANYRRLHLDFARRELLQAEITLTAQMRYAEGQFRITEGQAKSQRDFETKRAQQAFDLVKQNINIQWRTSVNA